MVESPFAPLPTFLSGERKVYKRSAFSAPRVLRRGDAFRKAADGFRRIAERFADLFRKFLLEALIGCSRAELVRALRRPHEGGRHGRLNCSRCVPLCAVGEGLAPPVPYVIEQANASLREGGGTAKP